MSIVYRGVDLNKPKDIRYFLSKYQAISIQHGSASPSPPIGSFQAVLCKVQTRFIGSETRKNLHTTQVSLVGQPNPIQPNTWF